MGRAQWPVPTTAVSGACAGTIVWRRYGRLHVTAVVKASLSFVPESTMTLTDPEPIAGPDGADPHDMAPFHKLVGIWMVGHAQIDPAASSAPVRLMISRGNRVILTKSTDLLGKVQPVSPGCLPLTPFGPIARPRALELGQRIVDVPEQLQPEALQWAPADQRLERLVGNEWIGIAGTQASGKFVSTQLPKPKASARLYSRPTPGTHQQIQLVISTVVIDVDKRRCSLIWRGQALLDTDEALDNAHIVAGVELSDDALEFPDPFDDATETLVSSPADASHRPSADMAAPQVRITSAAMSASPPRSTPPSTVLDDGDAPAPALPFARRDVGTAKKSDDESSSSAAPTPVMARRAKAPTETSDASPLKGTLSIDDDDMAEPALPFAGHHPRPPAPTALRGTLPIDELLDEPTRDVGMPIDAPALPFDEPLDEPTLDAGAPIEGPALPFKHPNPISPSVATPAGSSPQANRRPPRPRLRAPTQPKPQVEPPLKDTLSIDDEDVAESALPFHDRLPLPSTMGPGSDQGSGQGLVRDSGQGPAISSKPISKTAANAMRRAKSLVRATLPMDECAPAKPALPFAATATSPQADAAAELSLGDHFLTAMKMLD